MPNFCRYFSLTRGDNFQALKALRHKGLKQRS